MIHIYGQCYKHITDISELSIKGLFCVDVLEPTHRNHSLKEL